MASIPPFILQPVPEPAAEAAHAAAAATAAGAAQQPDADSARAAIQPPAALVLTQQAAADAAHGGGRERECQVQSGNAEQQTLGRDGAAAGRPECSAPGSPPAGNVHFSAGGFRPSGYVFESDCSEVVNVVG